MSGQGEHYHLLTKAEKKEVAKYGWANWYVNRGRLPLEPTKKDLRSVSWKRVF